MRKTQAWLLVLLLVPACRAYHPTPITRVSARSQLLLRSDVPFAVTFMDTLGAKHECMVTEVRGEAREPIGDTLQFAKFSARGQSELPASCLKGIEGRVVRPPDSMITLRKKRFSPQHTLALMSTITLFLGAAVYVFISSFTVVVF